MSRFESWECDICERTCTPDTLIPLALDEDDPKSRSVFRFAERNEDVFTNAERHVCHDCAKQVAVGLREAGYDLAAVNVRKWEKREGPGEEFGAVEETRP